MAMKLVSAIVAIVLMVVFTGAVAVKLKELALAVVTLIGIVLMLADLWLSLRSRDD